MKLIFARSFLSTARAIIDVAAGIIKLNINGKEDTFGFKPKRIAYCNQIGVSIGNMGKNAKTPRKKHDTTKYSKPKSIWRMRHHL
jgi:hypothetical protein